MDSTFVNGAIAVKEKSLLGEKIKRLCEGSAEDAFRQLTESGFGVGAEAFSCRDYEALIFAEERAIDAFVRTAAPSSAERDYLFLERDFHNAEALVKAEYLSLDEKKMLCPEGNFTVGEIASAVQSGETGKLGALGEAIKKASALFTDEETKPTGAEIGALFSKALFESLRKSCKKSRTCANLLAQKADMTNLLTAFRSPDIETAKKLFVVGGKLSTEKLSCVFLDSEHAERAFEKTPYFSLVHSCIEDKKKGFPFTQAEKTLAHFEIAEFSRRRFELNGSETFLYYVLRRRLECDDVRIIFVCLRAGLQEADIKKRLRSLREGL